MKHYIVYDTSRSEDWGEYDFIAVAHDEASAQELIMELAYEKMLNAMNYKIWATDFKGRWKSWQEIVEMYMKIPLYEWAQFYHYEEVADYGNS